MGYEVAYVTRYIEDVKLCDILLVENFLRISRKEMEFAKIYKMFKKRSIRIERAIGENYMNGIFSTKDIYEALESFFKKEKEFDKQ